MDLQELIRRGRFLMADTSERLRVFELVNGKRTAKDIAKLTRRIVTNVRRDLTLMFDAGLLEKPHKDGKPAKKDGFDVFDKVPLARTIPIRFFKGPSVFPGSGPPVPNHAAGTKKTAPRRAQHLPIPSEAEILDIANNGESQLVEFKGRGTDVRKVTREIAAMLNTRQGGQIFYGIDDDGNIEGSDLTPQKLDQPLQNSVRNSISPPATIRTNMVKVMGNQIIIITVPPWDRRHVYMFDEKVLIRKGTNVFAAKPDELRQLHSGRPVI